MTLSVVLGAIKFSKVYPWLKDDFSFVVWCLTPTHLTAFAFSMFAQKSINICAMYDLVSCGLRLDFWITMKFWNLWCRGRGCSRLIIQSLFINFNRGLCFEHSFIFKIVLFSLKTFVVSVDFCNEDKLKLSFRILINNPELI